MSWMKILKQTPRQGWWWIARAGHGELEIADDIEDMEPTEEQMCSIRRIFNVKIGNPIEKCFCSMLY